MIEDRVDLWYAGLMNQALHAGCPTQQLRDEIVLTQSSTVLLCGAEEATVKELHASNYYIVAILDAKEATIWMMASGTVRLISRETSILYQCISEGKSLMRGRRSWLP